MRSFRYSFFASGGVALLSGLLTLAATTLVPTTAGACPEAGAAGACACGAACPSQHAGNCADAAAGCAGKDEKGAACACPPGEGGNCACGAECGAKHGGTCPKAAAGGAAEKKPGSCGCGGAGAAVEPGDKAAPCGSGATEGGAAQRAVIDPTTGQLVVPDKADAAQAAAGEPAAAQAQAAANAGSAGAAQQLAVPGAGVMAPFPKDRASHAVANVDDSGTPHTGCEHAAE